MSVGFGGKSKGRGQEEALPELDLGRDQEVSMGRTPVGPETLHQIKAMESDTLATALAGADLQTPANDHVRAAFMDELVRRLGPEDAKRRIARDRSTTERSSDIRPSRPSDHARKLIKDEYRLPPELIPLDCLDFELDRYSGEFSLTLRSPAERKVGDQTFAYEAEVHGLLFVGKMERLEGLRHKQGHFTTKIDGFTASGRRLWMPTPSKIIDVHLDGHDEGEASEPE